MHGACPSATPLNGLLPTPNHAPHVLPQLPCLHRSRAGAGRPRLAWLNTQVAVLMGTLSMIIFAGILMLYRNELGGMFSTDPEVILLTSQAVPTLAISLIGAHLGGTEGASQPVVGG